MDKNVKDNRKCLFMVRVFGVSYTIGFWKSNGLLLLIKIKMEFS